MRPTTLTGRYGSVILIVLFALVLQRPWNARANSTDTPEEQVCDPIADYYLGMEDYPEAIRLHELVIKRHPDNALAHYHLGFALGLMGNHKRELAEYETAINLGLSDWDLFLNLGLLYLDTGQYHTATKVLQLAALLAPDRPEPHFNLGLAYEKSGMLPEAEQEMLVSLSLDPTQIDARNSLGVIYAEEGDYNRARDEWTDLEKSDPGYSPARQNLALLRQVQQGGIGETPPSDAFAHTR
ncbi:MAG: tetratricopeptide repeat protein [Candidatus Binataceae bacterium]